MDIINNVARIAGYSIICIFILISVIATMWAIGVIVLGIYEMLSAKSGNIRFPTPSPPDKDA